MITEYDIKMAAYIVKAMKQPNLNVFFSWGGHDYKPIKDGVSFAVNGFIHHGEVRVVYDHCEDLFVVSTLNADTKIEYAYMLGSENGATYKRFCTAEKWFKENGGHYIDNNFKAYYNQVVDYFEAKEMCGK